MKEQGPSEKPRITPNFSRKEVEERLCLDFHLAELDRLLERELISADAFLTVATEARARREAIDRTARGRAEYEAAERLMTKDPRAALALAELARHSDPGPVQTWELALELRLKLGDDEAAIKLCEEAHAAFPGFKVPVDKLRREAAQRAASLAAAQAAAENAPKAFPLAQVREALERGDDDSAVALCLEQLARQPNHYDTLVILATTRVRQERLKDALDLYRKLDKLEPTNPKWTTYCRSIEKRLAPEPLVAVVAPRNDQSRPKPPVAAPVAPAPREPRISWSNIAGQFLQEHWQKLILCLAVLLIVVGSTVGAYQLMGPMLWSEVGRCVLAMVYTAMFAGLGVGLARWGAKRSGRILLMIALLVAPGNFMLMGQMKLLTEPTAWRLGVLVLDAGALYALIRLVASALNLGRVAGFLSTALFVLGAWSIAASPGSPWPWPLQFAVFLAPAVVFLGSVVRLTTRPPDEPSGNRLETTYFALGLLAFTFVSAAIRTGIFALELNPTLYALAVMAAALACVWTAAGLEGWDPDRRRAQWMLFAGLVLSGLAMAMAMAKPPGPSQLYGGNTLATALLGLGLYTALLRSLRKPAFLYFALGALLVSYFGALFLARDLIHPVEELARRGLGYKKLSEPFRALSGLVFSPLLAALSIFFRRAWNDDRLARHCHYVGVPLSVGACVWSGFDPKTAVICLSGYAVLYAAAAWVFAAPWVVYLATAAAAGTAFFGITLTTGLSFAEEALGASVLGLGYWLLAAIFRRRGVDMAYRRPLDHSALTLAVIGMLEAAYSIIETSGAVSPAAAAAFLVVGLVATLVNSDEPSRWLGYMAVICGNTGLALLAVVVADRRPGGLRYPELATAAAAIGLVGAELGNRLRKLAGPGEPSLRAGVFSVPLFEGAFVQIGLALVLCGVHVGRMSGQLTRADFAMLAVAMALVGATLALLTRPYPVVGLARLAFACALGVWVCVAQVIHGGTYDGFGDYAALCAGFALALMAVEEAARAIAAKRKGADPDFQPNWARGVELFARALPEFQVGLVLFAAGLAGYGFVNGPEVVFTFAAGAVAILWSTRFRRSEHLLDLGLAMVYAAALNFTDWRVVGGDLGYTLAWLGLTSAACSLALQEIGRLCGNRPALAFYAWPCIRAGALMTGPVFGLMLAGRLQADWAFPVRVSELTAVTLGLLGTTLALLTRPYPVVGLARLSFACALGVWVCVAQVIHGGTYDGFGDYAALCAGFALALMAVEEAARAIAAKRKGADPDFQPTWARGVELFARALPEFQVGLVLFAAGLAGYGLVNGPEVVFTFAAGAVAILWSTRFRRAERLLDLGLAMAYAAALLLTDWRVGGSDLGYTLAWLGLTSATCVIALREVGRLCGSRPALAFYAWPCVRAAALTTWPVFVLAVAGRVDSFRAFPVSAAALVVVAIALALLGRDRRLAVYTYRAVVAAVCAVYVVVLSVGSNSPDPTYVLGLVAVLIALVLSAVGFFCRWGATHDDLIERLYAQPVFNSSLVLTVLAIAPAYRSPWTMLVVGLSFLVMVKGIPSREWLYATIASVGCALSFGVLAYWSQDHLVAVGMAAAYLLWLIGLLVRRAEPTLIRWLRLPHEDYDYPFFNSAAAACAAAVILRVSQTWDGPLAWSDSAGLALVVAGFLLLMVKPYPHAGWVHASTVLASASAGLWAQPRIGTSLWWIPLGMAMANSWGLVGWVLGRYGAVVRERLGIPGEGYREAFAFWSRAFFVLATTAVGAIVIQMVLTTYNITTWPRDPATAAEWLAIVLAIALGEVYSLASWRSAEGVFAVMSLEAWPLLLVWWLASPALPLVDRLGMNALVFLPLATAGLSVASVAAKIVLANRPRWLERFWGSAEVLKSPHALSFQGGPGLAPIGVLMTRAQVNPTTVGTLLLVTVASGLTALFRRSVAGAYIGAFTWCAAGLFAVLVEAREFGVHSNLDVSIVLAAVTLAALGVLWAIAGLFRRGEPKTAQGEASRLPATTIALALEQVAMLAALFTAASVAASVFAFGPGHPSPWAAITATAVLGGLALFAIGLVVRWGDEWLVYAAQASTMAGYLYYRRFFSIPAAADAAVLTLFGYLNLGLAEAMHRVGLERFARPTRNFALALPLLPLALTIVEGDFSQKRLFFLFSAATFYAIAGVAMRWRSLGYASAVFYNAFLWFLWSQIGWTLSDSPQFFLIPVCLSAILFAEVERKSLGRDPANTIRGIGLAVVYFSLAFPLWRVDSLGAWAAILFVSLAGILVGIGLRIQVFLWLGLVGFVLDIVYQLGHVGLKYTLAKWAIMLSLGLVMILFVALNEKKRIVPTMRDYLDQARQWD